MSNNTQEHIIGGNNYVNIKKSNHIKLYEQFRVFSQEGPIDMDVEITADFATIPEQYHEIFLNVLTAKYMNKVSYGDNPFSQCKPMIRRKWWQFWKSKYITLE